MTKEFIEKSPYQLAYAAWFSEYERERRKIKRRCGAKVPGLRPPPTNPDEISQALDSFGRREFLTICGVHRSTLTRWETGAAVMPRSAWLLLTLLAEGRLPGMSNDWRDWRFDGDRICLIGTRLSYTPRELAGWPYQQAHAAALARQVVNLELKIQYLLRVGDFEAQNDALMNTR